jgi:hypothetical protein
MAYTRSKHKRRRISQYFERRDHLISGSGQTIQTPDDVDDVMSEVEEELEEAMDAADIATEGETIMEHGIVDAIEAEIGHNPATAIHHAHRRGRHFLPLQPGILTCR